MNDEQDREVNTPPQNCDDIPNQYTDQMLKKIRDGAKNKQRERRTWKYYSGMATDQFILNIGLNEVMSREMWDGLYDMVVEKCNRAFD